MHTPLHFFVKLSKSFAENSSHNISLLPPVHYTFDYIKEMQGKQDN
jgi:hypothetical protein